VQGVGFRWWTRSLAQRVGVVGTVRNAADGSVEVQARGSDDQLARLERHLREGPPHAQVDGVESIPVALPEAADRFEIVR
jgi:acylphosphatase